MYSTTKKHVEITGNQWSHKCISRRPVTPVRKAEELDYYSSPMQVSKADELLQGRSREDATLKPMLPMTTRATTKHADV